MRPFGVIFKHWATELLLLIRSLWNVNMELCLVIQTCICCIVRPFSQNNVQMLTYMKQWLRCRANKRHFERTWLVIPCCLAVQKLSILITHSWLFCLSIRADSGRLCGVGSSKNVVASVAVLRERHERQIDLQVNGERRRVMPLLFTTYIYALLLRSSKIESVFFSLCSTCGPVSCMQHKYYSNPIDAVFFLFFAMLYHLAIRYYVGSLSLSYLPKTCLNAKKNEQSFIGQEGIRDVTSAIVIARWAKITFRHESKLSFINSRVTT